MSLKLVLVAAMSFAGVAALAAPAEVLIIRHGEKTKDSSGDEVGRDLSPKGYQRANALPQLFMKDKRMLDFGTPVAIYAGSPKHADTGSIRPLETVEPTAKALGLKVDTDYQSKDFESMVNEVMSEKKYEGKTVLISWPHDQIPDMAKAFGVKKSDVPDWSGDTFDRVWRIKFDENGDVSDFDNLPQHLLPGDDEN